MTAPDGTVYENVIPALEQAEKWLEWAHKTAIDLEVSWSDNSSNTRYNLNQFWALKSEHYAEDANAWDELDVIAHGIWASLAEMGMVRDNPPAQQKYRDEAQQAYAGRKAAMQRVGRDTTVTDANAKASADWFAQAQSQGVDDRLSVAVKNRATELLNDTRSALNAIAGIPMWAYAVAGLGLIWLIFGRKS